ncbi:hypothetical protein WR11_21690, partial [Escherichia coli]
CCLVNIFRKSRLTFFPRNKLNYKDKNRKKAEQPVNMLTGLKREFFLCMRGGAVSKAIVFYAG